MEDQPPDSEEREGEGRLEEGTIMTSVNPCAAPERSTLLPSVLRVSNSHGTRSRKFSSPIPRMREPRALAATDRTSGIGSTRTYMIPIESIQ